MIDSELDPVCAELMRAIAIGTRSGQASPADIERWEEKLRKRIIFLKLQRETNSRIQEIRTAGYLAGSAALEALAS